MSQTYAAHYPATSSHRAPSYSATQASSTAPRRMSAMYLADDDFHEVMRALRAGSLRPDVILRPGQSLYALGLVDSLLLLSHAYLYDDHYASIRFEAMTVNTRYGPPSAPLAMHLHSFVCVLPILVSV
ncbi:unnamed protein product [Peniophora sp. CBMAI 1063]|nr:unnamed protein product [Peniophora sp. CBMAI 1063]